MTPPRSDSMELRRIEREQSELSRGPASLANIAFLDAIRGNQPVFTRALVEQAAQDLDQASDPKTRDLPITIAHVYGDGATTKLISEEVIPHTLYFEHSFRMARQLGNCPPYRIIGDHGRRPDMATRVLKPNEPNQLSRQLSALDMPELRDQASMRAAEAALLASPVWADIQQKLLRLPVRVDNIVCAALGEVWDLSSWATGGFQAQAYTQHVLASMMSGFLVKHYTDSSASGATTAIPIIAHDPCYGLSSMHTLSLLSPPIDVVWSPHHYLSVTPNTLVMAVCMPTFVPFHEVVADMCFPGGPAAILCSEIRDFVWHEQGMMMWLDNWTPRVGDMLQLYEKSWLGQAWQGCEV